MNRHPVEYEAGRMQELCEATQSPNMIGSERHHPLAYFPPTATIAQMNSALQWAKGYDYMLHAQWDTNEDDGIVVRVLIKPEYTHRLIKKLSQCGGGIVNEKVVTPPSASDAPA